jgi:hypothetical protein
MQATGFKFPSFQHDAMIIEEQDDHMVFAVRVPKGVIAANVPFIAAAVERTGPLDTPFSPAADPPRLRKFAKVHWPYAAILLCAALMPSPFGSFANVSWAGLLHIPPLEYRSWYMTKAVFKVGETITYGVEYHRDRVCSTTVDRNVTRAGGEATTMVFSDRKYGAATSPESGWHTFRASLAAPLPVGEYTYRGNTRSECADGNYDAAHGTMNFSVVE